MKKIRIAQIGTGHDHASYMMSSIRKLSNIFDVVGYSVLDSEHQNFSESLDVYQGISHMSVEDILNYPGLNAVVIETEEENLTKYSQMAADKGLHIHMDKPGSADMHAFENLIRTTKQKNLVLHMGYMYRYNPAVQKVFEIIKSGKLGEIYCIEAQMNCEHNQSKREWLGKFKGGMMFYLGCHLVDLIIQIQGIPENIIPLNRSTGIHGVTAEDYGMVVFKYKNGNSFAKTCAAELGGFQRRQLVICGTNGTIEIKPLEMFAENGSGSSLYTEMTEVFLEDTTKYGWQDCRKPTRFGAFDRYDDMMKNFAAMVCGEKQNPYTYEYELLLQRILLKSCGMEIEYQQSKMESPI